MPTRVIPALCLALSLTLPSAAQSPPAQAQAAAWPSDAVGLNQLATKLANDWLDAVKAKDSEKLGAMLAPCFQMVTFRGAVDKTGAIARLMEAAVGTVTLGAMNATRVGDTLVATWTLAGYITVSGTSMPATASPRLAVWQSIDGKWTIAAMASLNIPDQRPAASAPAFAGDTALNADGQAMLATFLGAQHTKDMPKFEGMLAEGMQVVNFKGQKLRADIIQGAQRATTGAPNIQDARATRCGALTIVSCNLGMSQKIVFTSLPDAPVPFLAVFTGTGADAKVIALANTNRPE